MTPKDIIKVSNRKVWLTADEHFGSSRTLEFSQRPFETVDDMDDAIITNIREVVKYDDIVVHNGDFGTYERVKEIPGSHILIIGNYEENDIKTKFNGSFEDFSKYVKSIGFVSVIPYALCNEVEGPNGTIVDYFITHKPEDCIKENPNTQFFNLYAHIHGRQTIRKYGIDIGVDAHHFYPINMDTVHFYHNAILRHYDNNVFE